MNQTYDKSFQQEAIRLALTSDKPIAQTARDLGIKRGTLYNWVSQAKKSKVSSIEGNEKLNATQLVDELNRLRKENARLKEEREILEKAAVFFAKEEQRR